MTTIDPDATTVLFTYLGRHRASERDVVQVDLSSRSWLLVGLRDAIMALCAVAAIIMSIDAFL